MAKILTLSDKPLGSRKTPNARTRKEWAKKNARFRRMLINKPDIGNTEWIPSQDIVVQGQAYDPCRKLSDNIFSAMMCGLAAYKLFR